MAKNRGRAAISLCAVLAAGGLLAAQGRTDQENARRIPQTGLSSAVQSQGLEFTVLDVGQGLSVLMESQDHCLLYDGGDGEHSSYVVGYLKKKGIKTLDYLVASHYDEDHLHGVIGAMQAFEVDHLLAPDYEEDTKTYQSFERMAKKEGIPITAPRPGDKISLGKASLTVLSPAKEEYEDVNDYSISLRAVCGKSSFLVTGDASRLSEDEMLKSGRELDSDVLVVGHHGGADATSLEFLKEVSPAYGIISCEKDNTYGHPAPSVMKRLKKAKIQIYRTDEQGTVVADGDRHGVHFKQKPCNDYTPRIYQPLVTAEETTAVEAAYVLNSSSGKFHRPSCQYAQKIGKGNYKKSEKSREQLMKEGYSPCKICRP